MLVLSLTVVLFLGAVFVLLQTEPAKNYLTQRAEIWFNEHFEGSLTIREIGGVIPLNIALRGVEIHYEDQTPATIESMSVSVDMLAMLRNQLSITDITVHTPEVWLQPGPSGKYTLIEALQRKQRYPVEEVMQTHVFRTMDIYAPFVQIFEGKLHVDSFPGGKKWSPLSTPLTVEAINTEMFLEVSDEQRFLDITYLTLSSDELPEGEVTLSGQIYNDDRYLELNALQLGVGSSWIEWSSELDGINLYEGDLASQFREAAYLVMVDDAFLAPSERRYLFPGLPHDLPGMQFSLQADARNRVLNVTGAEIGAGNSLIRFDAALNDVTTWDSLYYSMDLEELRMDREELHLFIPEVSNLPVRDWTDFRTGGTLMGNRDTMEVNLSIGMPEGTVTVKGRGDLAPSLSADLFIGGRDINLASFMDRKVDGEGEHVGAASFPETQIHTEIHLTGVNLTDSDYELTADMDFFGSRIGDIMMPDVQLDVNYAADIIRHEFVYYQNENYLEGKGRIELGDTVPHFVLNGRSSGINLDGIVRNRNLPRTAWNMDYDINWHGFRSEEWFGRIIADVLPSEVNGQELRAHQMYLDLNQPGSPKRSLRLTSSVLDFLVEGNIEFSSASRLYDHWSNYFVERVREELMFDPVDTTLVNGIESRDLLQAEVLLEFKDLELLRTYIPDMPAFDSGAQLTFNIHSDQEVLEVDAYWRDEHMEWNGISARNTQLLLDTRFRYDRHFRNDMDLNLELTMDRLIYEDHSLDTLLWTVNLDNDALHSRGRIANFGNNVQFSSVIEGQLTDSLFRSEVRELIVGNERYLWQSEGVPVFTYQEDGRLLVENFNLASETDHVFVNGVFSTSLDDSVEYRFDNVNLARISEMVDGKVDFEGVLNADFVTKNLREHPVVHGYMNVDRLSFNDRIVGNVDLISRYNTELDRFDTSLNIATDTTRYAEYIAENDGIGQNVSANGWIRAPVRTEPVDSLYHFEVDVEQLDLWVLIYLLDGVFEDVEGRGTGTGYFTGDLDYIDFAGDFEIHESTVIPVFFETEYELIGDVSVSRERGVELHQMDIRDRLGGTGQVGGVYDFNDFQAEKFMDINLDLNNLRFLNNSSGPDVPFYGSVAGTGVINISGSNISPYVRTLEPIRTTTQSRLSIPLIEQAMAEERGRYIRFVHDFREVEQSRQSSVDPEVLRGIDRSFMEVFRLDLQFIAAQNSTVQLIFDPVTGEIVNAQGGGRVRITLEDENLQIFGNFDISSGDYLFVGGDIMTRRFTLQDGGSIRWEGDPTNALLDITAVYRARPNIAPLLGAAADQTNRIPVELMLEISGPIDNIENDFYFEFPNAIDATQNAAVLNVLNSEEQKLIQATSLLFTGGFISGTLVGETQTQELGTTLQARAGQVGISQLLSSQINALLRDNLINLDVDLNLFGFDQADLGIALRLFDDRLVLRREGEVGGEETHIGDLGATYRINPSLSVEVFHRKDPMLMSILGDQADVERVNGVGLEAQFRFNTWREFAGNMWRNVTTLFGLWNREDQDEEPDTEVAATDEQ